MTDYYNLTLSPGLQGRTLGGSYELNEIFCLIGAGGCLILVFRDWFLDLKYFSLKLWYGRCWLPIIQQLKNVFTTDVTDKSVWRVLPSELKLLPEGSAQCKTLCAGLRKCGTTMKKVQSSTTKLVTNYKHLKMKKQFCSLTLAHHYMVQI